MFPSLFIIISSLFVANQHQAMLVKKTIKANIERQTELNRINGSTLKNDENSKNPDNKNIWPKATEGSMPRAQTISGLVRGDTSN